jgi:mannose-1-phosphate guanylyltransferase
MEQTGHTWALVLAAGDGRRLSDLTFDGAGAAVPKQYCSLCGGLTLLQETLQRARGFALQPHISVIVSARHALWWRAANLDIAAGNLVVQPENRGTANGILLQLLHVLERDPAAIVVLLPADHCVVDETALRQAIERALELVRRQPQRLALLGVEPTFADPDLGYILPGPTCELGAATVAGFVEKPAVARAAQLIAQGALWNTFIMVASARSLLAVFEARLSLTVAEMRRAMHAGRERCTRLVALYEQLPSVDFSRQLLGANRPEGCLLVPVPFCGWSDLGTPERVGQALSQFAAPAIPPAAALPAAAPINLAARFRRWQPRAVAI